MPGIITATGAAEWLRVSRLELLNTAEAACYLRISPASFYRIKGLPVVRPAGPRGSAHYLRRDLDTYLAATREVPSQPAA